MNVNFKWQAGMLFRHLLLRSVLLCGLLASCSKEEAADLSLTETDELRLGAAITGITRATDAGFEIGDTLGIFITKWQDASARDTLKESGNYTDNVLFRLENLSNDWVAEYPVYFPSDDNKIDLYAYYPYRNPAFVSGTSLGVKVFANQSVGNHYTRSDFMTAKTLGVSRTPNKVPLIFDHRLSQMVFILKPGAGFSVADLLPARLKIINAITDATFDLRDSVPVAGAVRSDIIPAGSWTAGSESLTGMKAILIPQELNPDTYVEITLGSRRFTYRPSSVHLNPGCSRVFTITVNNTGLDITTEINPWDNCPPVNGDAYEEFDPEPIVTMTTLHQNPSITMSRKRGLLVDWGDGVIEANVDSHTYEDGLNSHNIKIYGGKDVLKELYCDNIMLTHLDVSQNPALVELYCKSNMLTILDVSQNSALKILDCSFNQLTVLDVSKNSDLVNLDFCDNKLTALNVGTNNKLKNLYGDNNLLVSLDFRQNPHLINLYCSGNQLTFLDVSQSPDLNDLFCDDNQLTTLNVSKNPVLDRLGCTQNQITSLDLSQNIALHHLFCSDNQLTSLNVRENVQLKEIVCDKNPFIVNQSILVEFANSLSAREPDNQSTLVVNNSTSSGWIRSICTEKNWVIL